MVEILFLRLVYSVSADEPSNYRYRSAGNYFLFGDVIVLNLRGWKLKKIGLKEHTDHQDFSVRYPELSIL